MPFPAAGCKRSGHRHRPAGRRLDRHQQGQSLVELAVLLPVLLLILMGVLDFGRYFYAGLTVRHAAREGARYGAVHPGDDAGIRQRVEAAATGLDAGHLVVQVDPQPAQRRVGEPLTVLVRYPFQFITPLAGLVGEEHLLQAAVVVRIE
ncbi:pilus assembly protein [Thermaerobacter sp. PB12/4term]|uniref:TadE family protein n=1 Tax=Thermaerobacter sp. PB12/4term TaxID=2293838 RepID=UPI000E32B6D6|nr:TadE family protein [Thermaerobacter sp. PB12/4term]QIA27137.1 pilus assembly protein [Thermaerobacter sp. PB12/4term]